MLFHASYYNMGFKVPQWNNIVPVGASSSNPCSDSKKAYYFYYEFGPQAKITVRDLFPTWVQALGNKFLVRQGELQHKQLSCGEISNPRKMKCPAPIHDMEVSNYINPSILFLYLLYP